MGTFTFVNYFRSTCAILFIYLHQLCYLDLLFSLLFLVSLFGAFLWVTNPHSFLGQVLIYLDDILDSLLQALSDPSDEVIISSGDLSSGRNLLSFIYLFIFLLIYLFKNSTVILHVSLWSHYIYTHI